MLTFPCLQKLPAEPYFFPPCFDSLELICQPLAYIFYSILLSVTAWPGLIVWCRMEALCSWPKRLFGATARLAALAPSCGCARSIIISLTHGTPSLCLHRMRSNLPWISHVLLGMMIQMWFVNVRDGRIDKFIYMFLRSNLTSNESSYERWNDSTYSIICIQVHISYGWSPFEFRLIVICFHPVLFFRKLMRTRQPLE